MAAFYLSDDRRVLIRDADGDEVVGGMPPYSYFDRVIGDWVKDHDVGREIVTGDATRITEADAQAIIAMLKQQP